MNYVLPVKTQLKALESLQEVDLKIEGLKKQKAALPSTTKALEDVQAKAKQLLEQKKSLIADLEKTRVQNQSAVNLNNDRLVRSNQKLETVSNTQEYQAASKEIDQLKKLNSTLEDQIKRIQADIETQNTELTKLNSLFDESSKDLLAQKEKNYGVTGDLDSELKNLDNERTPFLSKIEKRILAQYDRVRAAKLGVGVAPAVGGRCGGCNMVIAPQLYNELHKDNAIHQCPSCHRIFYLPTSSENKSE